MNTRLSGEQVLARVKTLPALPQIVHELERALHSDTVSAERIVKLVASDQALTMTALRLANSSFYGASGRVVSLRDAVQILGLQTLSSAAMTAAVMARFDTRACPGFDVDGTWRHALATAVSAQMLAESRGVEACAAYTAGLLHDIGKLALAMHFPEPFAAALARSAEHEVEPGEAERAVLGIDHGVVGGLIARHWRLAPVVCAAIELHHDVPAEGSGGAGLLDVLHLADNITHSLDLSQIADDMVPPLSLAAWGRIGIRETELQQLFENVETRVQGLDLGVYR